LAHQVGLLQYWTGSAMKNTVPVMKFNATAFTGCIELA